MTVSPQILYLIMGGGVFAVAFLLISALSGGDERLDKRLARVGGARPVRKLAVNDRSAPHALRSTRDSSIDVIDWLIKKLPNPAKLRAHLARTGKPISLGEYMLINVLAITVCYLLFGLIGWGKLACVFAALALGIGVPHVVVGVIGNKRIKKFLATFPEAIDTMCRGIRSGLPITESIAAVGREMPDPVGIEFHRISDGVRMGKTLEDSMWEVSERIDAPEFRFLIIAMAIQKETGGNLAETLGNLADLIRKRRQLRLKIKAMSSEAKASAGIIGSLPFIMFCLLLVVNPEYVLTLFQKPTGKLMVGVGLFWMSLGWGVMLKMINFKI